MLNAESFSADGWFNTGDLGVVRDGRLTITGRSKDVIIVNGANFHSHEIEAVVEDVAGVERSFAAACAVRPAGSDTDRVCVFFTVSADRSDEVTVCRAIRDTLVERMGVQPDYLVPVERDDIPKTAIGKIQRAQLRAGFEAGEFDEVVKRIDLALTNARTLPDWFFERTWTPRAVRPGGGGRGRYLVFADRLGLAEAIREHLGDQAAAWITVEAADAFACVDAGRFRLDPTRPEDYQRLVADLTAGQVDIDHVLHLWTYTATPEGAGEAAAPAFTQFAGAFSLLYLSQALHGHRPGVATRLVHVSTAAQSTPGQTRFAPEKATAAGLLKTLALEIPALSCVHVDFEHPAVAADAKCIAAELRGGTNVADVAYRNGRRLEGWLVPVDLAHDPVAGATDRGRRSLSDHRRARRPRHRGGDLPSATPSRPAAARRHDASRHD